MNNYEIASELSQRVLEKRRREGEIAFPPVHEPHQVRHARLDLDEFRTRFTADEVLRSDEIPAGRYWKHGKR